MPCGAVSVLLIVYPLGLANMLNAFFFSHKTFANLFEVFDSSVV